MTNTPMSDLDPKVKELLEAARYVVDTGERNGLYRLGNAIAAFDPPKPEPVPVIPAWEEFVSTTSSIYGKSMDELILCYGEGPQEDRYITKTAYNIIRTLTSKAPIE